MARISHCPPPTPLKLSCASLQGQQTRDRADHPARAGRARTARRRRPCRARSTLRLSRARTLRAGRRPSVQPGQTADRPLHQAAGREFTGSDLHLAYRVGHKGRISRSTGAITPGPCSSRWWSIRPTPLAMTGTSTFRGKIRSSTKPTSKASRSTRGRSPGRARDVPRIGRSGHDRASKQAWRHGDQTPANPFVSR